MAFSLNDYDELVPLGSGGMGAVYLANQVSLNRKVVIKEMDPRLRSDTAYFKQFEHEAQSAASLDHDHVIRVYDFGEDHGLFYIAMEYIDGPNLEQMLGWDPFPMEIGLMVVLQALKGLHCAHQHGIAHRDFKPNNILVSRTGAVKVADFGIAYTTSQAISLLDTTPVFLTPEYMPPEQEMDTGVCNTRGDVWSAGVLLYRIICGKLPYSGENLAQLINAIVSVKERPLEACIPWLPADLTRNINACLIKDPEKRLASLDLVIESLQILISDMGILDIGNQIEKYIGDNRWTAVELERMLLQYHFRKGHAYRLTGDASKSAAHLDEEKRIRSLDPQPVFTGADHPETVVVAMGREEYPAPGTGEKHVGTMVAPRAPFARMETAKIAGMVLLIGICVAISAFLVNFMLQKYVPDIDAHVPFANPEYVKAPRDTQPAAAVPSPSREEVTPPSRHPAADRREKAGWTRRVKTADSRASRIMAVETRVKAPFDLPAVTAEPAAYASPRSAPTGKSVPAPATVPTPAPVVKGRGLLHIFSSPWSEVYIDDAYQGTAPTPRPVVVSEGEHVLRLQREGFESYRETLEMANGEMKRIRATLERSTPSATGDEAAARR